MNDLATQTGVLKWAERTGCAMRDLPITGDEESAVAIARAMRLTAVWDKHADKLRRFTAIEKADQPHYATVNRHTLSKALREFVADMAGAEEES